MPHGLPRWPLLRSSRARGPPWCDRCSCGVDFVADCPWLVIAGDRPGLRSATAQVCRVCAQPASVKSSPRPHCLQIRAPHPAVSRSPPLRWSVIGLELWGAGLPVTGRPRGWLSRVQAVVADGPWPAANSRRGRAFSGEARLWGQGVPRARRGRGFWAGASGVTRSACASAPKPVFRERPAPSRHSSPELGSPGPRRPETPSDPLRTGVRLRPYGSFSREWRSLLLQLPGAHALPR